MLFSLGNILTLLIVLVILAVYRQLDKNNRSLTKIKRYSEKIKEELDGFVESKTSEVKNLGIELDVHQKTGKEILKRIKSSEEELENRAASMQQINQRIAEYDKALSELKNMTSKVDENLQRLHSESEFVDKIGRQLSGTQDRIQHLEKRLPAITQEFNNINQKALKETNQKAFAHAKKLSDHLSEKVQGDEERLAELNGQIDTL